MVAVDCKICAFCGSAFHRKEGRSDSAWARQKFCSQRCNGDSKKTPKPLPPSALAAKECALCGKQFSRQAGESSISWGKRKYCSKSCVQKRHDRTPARQEKRKRFQQSDRGREVSREYVKNRRNDDVQYLLASKLRSRLWSALKGKGVKSGSAIRDLGCSLAELKRHLECKMLPCMKWENYGKKSGKMCWHIDHITPLSAFDLTKRDEFLKANHYTNLQPMCYVENLRKSAKLAWDKVDLIDECPHRVG